MSAPPGRADTPNGVTEVPHTEELHARIRELERQVVALEAERNDGGLDLADALTEIDAKEAAAETARHWRAFIAALAGHLDGLEHLPFRLRAQIEQLGERLGA